MGPLKTISNGLRSVDMFGIPVQLTFNGKTHFRTPCGGVISIIIMLVFCIGGLSTIYESLTNPVY